MLQRIRPQSFAAGLLLFLQFCGMGAAMETTLSRPEIPFTVPAKEYVILRRGDLEAVVVDNRKGSDAVLPGHGAGYSGIGSLRHTKQSESLFVPAYAGLNFEHIHDGRPHPSDILFEPRRAPMQLRVIDTHTAELYQPPTPYWGLESCTRYQLLENGCIEMSFECIPRRATFTNGYIGLFWASYIQQPECLDIHFKGVQEGTRPQPRWIRGMTPFHGTLATHRPVGDSREFSHSPDFALELPFGFSKYRYSEPWYYGVCRGMAFVQLFRPTDQVWFSQSPSGGGTDCPAWDFQWHIPDPHVGKTYRMQLRAAYLPLPDPQHIQAVRDTVERSKTTFQFSP